MQKDKFRAREGDAWFARMRDRRVVDALPSVIVELQMKPKSVLEIGCSDGFRLIEIQRQTGAACFGVDPSPTAIATGQKTYPELSLSVGTAEKLPFENTSFDLVIFGFCLYLTDPTDHFRIAAEADRTLRDHGFLVIKDFGPSCSYKNPYSHADGLWSMKMDWSRMFSWHPSYRHLSRRYFEENTSTEFTFHHDDAAVMDTFRKDTGAAFPIREAQG